MSDQLRQLRGASVLLAGAGNIGSFLAPLLARAGVGLLRLVDRDRVEEKNLAGQDYDPEDVGRPKAEVLADRLRRRFPGLAVQAHAADLEDLPLGTFEVDVLLGALDSRQARQAQQALDANPDGPVEVFDERTNKAYVLIGADAYGRAVARLAAEDDQDVQDLYPLMWEVFDRDGWDDPALDVYNDWDSECLSEGSSFPTF